jgi:hypothetical protein
VSIRVTITVILACLIVAACAPFQAYDGRPLPNDETALISIAVMEAAGWHSNLTAVDDRELRYTTRVRVLPGRRCIMLEAQRTSDFDAGGPSRRFESVLCFDAAADRSYEVRVSTQRPQQDIVVRVGIVDLGTGDAVADGVVRQL